MKPTNDPRHDLLDDLYSPLGHNSEIAADSVVTWVEEARRARRRRQNRIRMGAAVAVAGVIATFAFRVLLLEPVGSASKNAAFRPAEFNSPTIQLLSDEELLRLIEKAPAAIAKWPDGRRSLLLLVRADDIPDGH
jgi:hypothetical protein